MAAAPPQQPLQRLVVRTVRGGGGGVAVRGIDGLLLVSAALTPYLEGHETAVAACCYPVPGVMRLPINSSTERPDTGPYAKTAPSPRQQPRILPLLCATYLVVDVLLQKKVHQGPVSRSLYHAAHVWALAPVVAAGAAASPGEVDAGDRQRQVP